MGKRQLQPRLDISLAQDRNAYKQQLGFDYKTTKLTAKGAAHSGFRGARGPHATRQFVGHKSSKSWVVMRIPTQLYNSIEAQEDWAIWVT